MVEANALLSTEECSGKQMVWALRRSSGRTGEKKKIFLLTATPEVWPAPLRLSIKRAFL